MATLIKMAIEPHQGYTPDQVSNSMTLYDLKMALDAVIEEHGEDARIITYDLTNQYGAQWGGIDSYSDLFELLEDEGECEICGADLSDGEHDTECSEA